MGQFRMGENLVSLRGMCRGNNRTAEKRKPEKIRRGGRWLKPALVEAAWAAVRRNDSYLSAQYHRMVPHKGKKKALIAVCHSMLIAAYYMLKNRVPSTDLRAHFFVPRNQHPIHLRS